ncbi:MAG: 2-amino-4-hydroxy-6-hydroxymethyldihydropteridine diphosphokinase [Deltaproteobacteria bacterium]|nr:2-amino-4-hydroxy-6-hydroxymethyldihydropteridine diphosphokinase [Deltaproteobacteria bacterium]
MPERVYIGLGGNIGNVPASFAEAISALRALPGITEVRVSSMWESTPVGPFPAQPRFLNACAELTFAAGEEPRPAQLLWWLLDIEGSLGRDRGKERRGGPRPIDLDILAWGSRVIDDSGPPEVVVPHPRLHQRAFALAPLVELAGEDLVIPGPSGGRAGDLLAASLLGVGQEVRKITPTTTV